MSTIDKARGAAGRRTVAVALGVGVVTLAALLSGCASSTRSGSGGDAVAENAQLHADLPAAVRDRGTLRIVTDASYPPASSFAPDGRTIIGFEPDLGAALGQVLGVRVVFSNASFDSLPRLLHSDRADMIMSAMTDTADREKSLDFVDYFSAGASLVVQRGNPHGVTDLTSLCGQKVAVETGTVEADLLQRQQRHCGADRLTLVGEPTNDDALIQLRTGQVAAVPMDYPPAEFLTTNSRTGGSYQLASTTQYEPGPYGIGFDKRQSVLRDTVQSALTQLIRSGRYRQILRTWNVSSGAVPSASTNSAGGG